MSLANDLEKKYKNQGPTNRPAKQQKPVQQKPVQQPPGAPFSPGLDLSKFALETGGILGGAALGAPFLPPIGPVVGAGLGYAGAKRIGDALSYLTGTPGSSTSIEQQVLESLKALPRDVAIGAASEAVPRAVLGGIGFTGGKIASGIKNMIAGQAKVPQELTQEIFEHPTTFFRKGSLEGVENSVKTVQKQLEAVKTRAGQLYEQAKADIGISETPQLQIKRMAAGEFKPISPDELSAKYLAMQSNAKTVDSMTSSQKKAALNRLVRFRRQLDQTINWEKTTTNEMRILKGMREDLNEQITKLPGGEQLRQADEHFSEVSEIVDSLKNQFSDVAKSGGSMESLLKTASTIRQTLKSGETLSNLRKLETTVNKDLFRPFVKESATLASKPLVPPSKGGLSFLLGIGSPFVSELGVAAAGAARQAVQPLGPLSPFASRGLALKIIDDIAQGNPSRPTARDSREMTVYPQ